MTQAKTPAEHFPLSAPHFLVRLMGPDDATGRLRDWFADPVMMFPMNLPHRLVPVPDLQNYIRGFDRQNRFLLAIDHRESGAMCGFFIITMDHRSGLATLDLMVDQRIPMAALASLEAISVIGDWTTACGVQKTIANMRPENTKGRKLMKMIGYPEEGLLRGEVPEQTGQGGRVDIHRFGLLTSDWPQLKARVQERLDRWSALL